MAKGKINVTSENIFPVIKKFLYSDHEIFLRELVSNAVDATEKLKHLSTMGKIDGELGDTKIEVSIDKDARTLTIKDRGIGMTSEEVEKYITDIAFSGAEEFMEKYKEEMDGKDLIGHFGLGFYSAFMVAEQVEIFTKSHAKDSVATHWACDGSPEYTIEDTDQKQDRGTEIVLHIDKDSDEFLEEHRITELLNKYSKFVPVEIKFGTKEETITEGEGDDKTETKVTVDNIINNTAPAWTKQPSELTDENYNSFYKELYPMNFEDPLFHIHLNVDYPFNLTGILYFPKISKTMDLQKDKIQLYQNQVYITDNVENIVPDFLNMLKGVIDSPDIPLNVSRSYLQADAAVKRISGHITKKVADKLNSMFKEDREDFQQKWEDIKIIIEYGMLSEQKFYDKAKKFALFPTVKNEFFTIDELVEKTKANQTDKDGNTVILYSANKEAQHSYIERAEEKGYEVVLLDSPIVSHLIQKIEQENDKVKFVRVDADAIDKLIDKDEPIISKLSKEEEETLKPVVEGAISDSKYTVQMETLDSKDLPFIITVPEFMRRMKEQAQTGGGMMGMGQMPEMYNLVVNTNNELITEILNEKDEDRKGRLVRQGFDLAKLQQNLLHGADLTNFIRRSVDLIK
ncbi:MAG: molecular chaperone HtpG [Ichthyobacteriaceae bacterium]|nr:molecular chaperone HtpG [Ichthyobacteriaceae bacterium]